MHLRRLYWIIKLLIIFTISRCFVLSQKSDCLQECTEDAEAFASNVEIACNRFKLTPPKGVPYASCTTGYSVGSSIGCMHRCENEKSKWNMQQTRLTSARRGACGKAAHARACTFGFSFAVMKVFEEGLTSSTTLPSKEASDHNKTNTTTTSSTTTTPTVVAQKVESYISFPVQLPSKAVVYIYMDSNETPEVTASAFCAKQSLSSRELEIECVASVTLGLSSRMLNAQWQEPSWPRVQMYLPVIIAGEELNLVTYQGESAEKSATAFCNQLSTTYGNGVYESDSDCVKGILPRLLSEVSKL